MFVTQRIREKGKAQHSQQKLCLCKSLFVSREKKIPATCCWCLMDSAASKRFTFACLHLRFDVYSTTELVKQRDEAYLAWRAEKFNNTFCLKILIKFIFQRLEGIADEKAANSSLTGSEIPLQVQQHRYVSLHFLRSTTKE